MLLDLNIPECYKVRKVSSISRRVALSVSRLGRWGGHMPVRSDQFFRIERIP
jgi:hypothetical protein